MEFKGFPKLYRLNGPVIVTEKIDGTNAQITITEDNEFLVGSRTRWITPENDNFGFARWAYDRKDALIALLGVGTHYGEFWGKGIQRGYGLTERRFSLFNTTRWDNLEPNDLSVYVVPVLAIMTFDTEFFKVLLEYLKVEGSQAAPGYMNPEGIAIYDTRSGTGYKKTYDYDDTGKGMSKDKDGNVIMGG